MRIFRGRLMQQWRRERPEADIAYPMLKSETSTNSECRMTETKRIASCFGHCFVISPFGFASSFALLAPAAILCRCFLFPAIAL